jgi:ELWxxDGT repeat protein
LLNGYVYFAADDGKHGKELWRSDGTVKRTKLFADVVPGKVGSAPREIVATSDRVYFVDDIQGATKEHLWKTDGLSVKLLETASNQFSGVFAGIYQLTPLSQTLYYTEDERGQIGGADSVWEVSATANSLKRVGNFKLPRMVAPGTQGDGSKRIFFYEPGSVDGSMIAIYGLRPQKPLSIVQTGLDPQRAATIVQVADDLYYSRGTDLWLSEGGKPRIVKSFPQTDRIVGVAALGVDAHPHVIVATATASHSIVPDHADLYVSDRTSTGTVLLKSTNIFSSVTMQFTDTIFASDRLYFVVHAPANSWDLWVSDDTSAGTHVT